ncbi:hypothetical protein CDD83_5106 [Cordyceps sp. RAO-2017]|nr:hypothetical protein CDD83_5106 [Cordyceps sp. RAO-2017]
MPAAEASSPLHSTSPLRDTWATGHGRTSSTPQANHGCPFLGRRRRHMPSPGFGSGGYDSSLRPTVAYTGSLVLFLCLHSTDYVCTCLHTVHIRHSPPAAGAASPRAAATVATAGPGKRPVASPDPTGRLARQARRMQPALELRLSLADPTSASAAGSRHACAHGPASDGPIGSAALFLPSKLLAAQRAHPRIRTDIRLDSLAEQDTPSLHRVRTAMHPAARPAGNGRAPSWASALLIAIQPMARDGPTKPPRLSRLTTHALPALHPHPTPPSAYLARTPS